MSTARTHGRPSGVVPEPVLQGQSQTHAEEARTILAGARTGTLCTHSAHPSGYPYGSIVNYATDDRGCPIFLISDLAEHTINLKKDDRASLLVTEAGPSSDVLALGRVTLLGKARVLSANAARKARDAYLERHPQAAYYADFKDFHFYSLRVEHIRYIGGFGRMSWVEVKPYREASPDPIYPFRDGILQHCNQDHADALLLLSRCQGGLGEATAAVMTGVDRYGFEMSVTTPQGPRLARLGFPQPAAAPDAVRAALIAMIKQARSQS